MAEISPPSAIETPRKRRNSPMARWQKLVFLCPAVDKNLVKSISQVSIWKPQNEISELQSFPASCWVKRRKIVEKRRGSKGGGVRCYMILLFILRRPWGKRNCWRFQARHSKLQIAGHIIPGIQVYMTCLLLNGIPMDFLLGGHRRTTLVCSKKPRESLVVIVTSLVTSCR